MQPIPPLDGLNWVKIRALARTLTDGAPIEAVTAAAVPLLDAPDVSHRQLGPEV